MLEFNSESWFHVKPDFDRLGQMNFIECGVAEGKRPYSLNHEFFEWAEKEGLVHVTTARHLGKLVGYVLSIISPRHVQYEAVCSQQIGMYLHPDFRRGENRMAGLKLMQEDEKSLRQKGVQKMYGGFTVDKDLSVLFKRRGWKEAEIHYVKWIGE